jgi:hypothetical protein
MTPAIVVSVIIFAAAITLLLNVDIKNNYPYSLIPLTPFMAFIPVAANAYFGQAATTVSIVLVITGVYVIYIPLSFGATKRFVLIQQKLDELTLKIERERTGSPDSMENEFEERLNAYMNTEKELSNLEMEINDFRSMRQNVSAAAMAESWTSIAVLIYLLTTFSQP